MLKSFSTSSLNEKALTVLSETASELLPSFLLLIIKFLSLGIVNYALLSSMQLHYRKERRAQNT